MTDREMLRIFGGDGPFMESGNYSPRAPQIKLASDIKQIIGNGGILMAEAGTGTGKSYAALVPSILSGERVVVATASIALQEQYLNDIPELKLILNKPDYKATLLKGRGNFLCQDLISDKHVKARLTSNQAKAIRELEGTGDRSDLSGAISNQEWSELSATNDGEDDCSGQNCPKYESCYYYKQRESALKADLVIINYHVLFVDQVFMGGKMLGEFKVLIADEAHRVAEIARDFFERTISTRAIKLIKDNISKLEKEFETEKLRSMSSSFLKQQQLMISSSSETNMPLLAEQFKGYSETLKIAKDVKRSVENELDRFEDMECLGQSEREEKRIFQRVLTKLEYFIGSLNLLINIEDIRYVRWITPNQDRAIKLRMLDVDEPLSVLFGRIHSSILMSATMCVLGDFGLIKRETGLVNAKTLSLKNIFDFDKQVKFYAMDPSEMPDPSNFKRKDYIQATVDKISEVISMTGGRTMVLFTSVEALKQAKETLIARFPRLNIYTQGDLASQKLAEQFKIDKHGILLGTRTFFEGIDIPGDALSCVILDRFPFQPMGDPMVLARQQRNPAGFYRQWYLPTALIVFKQAFGRLIRRKTDYGVFIILDPRVRNKYHGPISKTIQSNLPIAQWSEIKASLIDISAHL